MAATAPISSSATRISSHDSPISSLQRQITDRFLIKIPSHTHRATSFKRIAVVRASKPRDEDANAAAAGNDGPTFLSQEDLIYLVKLGGGSVAGAAAIKYGSVLFPQITHPNIVQALIMISTPVIISVFLLVKQSRVD